MGGYSGGAFTKRCVFVSEIIIRGPITIHNKTTKANNGLLRVKLETSPENNPIMLLVVPQEGQATPVVFLIIQPGAAVTSEVLPPAK